MYDSDLHCKPCTNNLNILMQHVMCNIVEFKILHIFCHPVAMCCHMFGVVGSNLTISKQHMYDSDLHCKPWTNNLDILMKHVATLLGSKVGHILTISKLELTNYGRFAPSPFRPKLFRPNSKSFRPNSKSFRPNSKSFRPNLKSFRPD